MIKPASILFGLLALCSPLRAQGQSPLEDEVPFERDIESVVFVPKGQWITGVSVSYTQSNQNKYQFLVIENLSGDTYNFKVAPMVMYAFANDMAAGIKIGYDRGLTKLEQVDFVLDSETDYGVDHLYRLGHNYYAMGVLRNYFSLGRSTRFGLFTEAQLQLGGGQSKITTGVGSDLSGSYETNFHASIGVAPGIAVFLNNYSALEVNVGVLGFNFTNTTTKTDQIYESSRRSKSARFNINLFSITFGVSFYL